MSRFDVSETKLPGLRMVVRKPLGDARGFLCRLFSQQELVSAGWQGNVVQINQTLTRKRGTVRGIHFQRPPHTDAKLVSCLHGEIWDVAVDLRTNSPGYLRWHGEKLSAENNRAMLIPAGFGHGFQTLCEDVELLYCHSTEYVPAADAGVRATDPRLGIEWPLPIAEISARDAAHPLLDDQFKGLLL